jgi:hypothetical protein
MWDEWSPMNQEAWMVTIFSYTFFFFDKLECKKLKVRALEFALVSKVLDKPNANIERTSTPKFECVCE